LGIEPRIRTHTVWQARCTTAGKSCSVVPVTKAQRTPPKTNAGDAGHSLRSQTTEIDIKLPLAEPKNNGKREFNFPHYRYRGLDQGKSMTGLGSYLKKHTEALVKDVGIEPACELTGKSKATLGRYYSDNEEHSDRFMPIDAVAALEKSAKYPHVTSALAEINGITLSYDPERRNSEGSKNVNSDVIALSQRFAMLMAEYNQSIEDGIISVNEAKRLLRETSQLQRVLIEMKMHLEEESGDRPV